MPDSLHTHDTTQFCWDGAVCLPQADSAKEAELAVVRSCDIGSALGLAPGCSAQRALVGVALLGGGDYGDGANRVGVKQAMSTVCYLLRGAQVSAAQSTGLQAGTR